MFNLNFYFALLAILASVIGGIYFLFRWLNTGRKHNFFLWWALGFAVIFIFKIPNVLINAGESIVQADFNFFFFDGLLLYLLSHYAFAMGLAHFAPSIGEGHTKGFFVVMFVGGAFYFFLSFFTGMLGVFKAPIWASNLLLYIPTQIFLLIKFYNATKEPRAASAISRVGSVFISSGILALLVSSIFYIVIQTSAHSPSFWYFSIVNSSATSFVQIIAILLLFFGFRSISKDFFWKPTLATNQ